MLNLYHKLWYLLKKFGNFVPSVNQTEEKHNWISRRKRQKLQCSLNAFFKVISEQINK